jgi:hypothetical protein
MAFYGEELWEFRVQTTSCILEVLSLQLVFGTGKKSTNLFKKISKFLREV